MRVKQIFKSEGEPPHNDFPCVELELLRDLSRIIIGVVAILIIAACCATVAGFIWLYISSAHARDDGRYASSPWKSWFDKLASAKGPCCSFADGITIEDVDWTVKGEGQDCDNVGDAGYSGQYCVRLLHRWWLVPDNALVTEPNRFGPAVVWPVYAWTGANSDIEVLTNIRCFIPGAGM